METYDVIVIGAGHNGLTCAALLAKAGRKVAVYERNPVAGGAAVSQTDVWPGYTLSVASYVLSTFDPWLVDELELRSYGLEYYRKDPYAFTPLLDGRSLLLGSDSEANAREIAAFDAADVAGFEAYGERTERAGRALFDAFSDLDPCFDNFDGDTQALMRGSAAELVERYVKTPVLQAELVNDGLIGTYLGPRDAGTGYVLVHHLAGRVLGIQGAWAFVRGGMGSLTRALAAAARRHGATIVTGKRVAKVLTFGDRAIGIVLDDGTEVGAKAIASNAHPRTTFLDLLDGGLLEGDFIEKVLRWKTVGPSLKLNLAPRHQSAAAPPRHDSRGADDRLPAEGLRRRARRRRKRGASDRMLFADADRSVARSAR
jgi:phytoene dehydrogenase-like protein